MNGHEYEHVVARYLATHGYSRTKVTKSSGDYGVDVIAYKGGLKYAVQCKYYSRPVGVDAVQEVVAGKAYYKCDAAMVVTNSTFTKAAENLARVNNVKLLSGVKSEGFYYIFDKIDSKWFLFAILAGYAFICMAAISAVIDISKPNGVVTTILNCISSIVILLIPLWAFLIFKLIKRFFPRTKNVDPPIITKKTKNEKIVEKTVFVLNQETINNNEYWQTAQHHKRLNVSSITGLPCQFNIMEKVYNIDSISDIQAMPLIFSSFSVNGQTYYFNDYFRMCATVYRQNGYEDIAKALIEKADELESDPLYGKFIKKQAHALIEAPKPMSKGYKEFLEKHYE